VKSEFSLRWLAGYSVLSAFSSHSWEVSTLFITSFSRNATY